VHVSHTLAPPSPASISSASPDDETECKNKSENHVFNGCLLR